MSSDLIHFRVGPARIYQFRKEINSECLNFELNWSDRDQSSTNASYSIPQWQLKSPLYQ